MIIVSFLLFGIFYFMNLLFVHEASLLIGEILNENRYLWRVYTTIMVYIVASVLLATLTLEAIGITNIFPDGEVMRN